MAAGLMMSLVFFSFPMASGLMRSCPHYYGTRHKLEDRWTEPLKLPIIDKDDWFDENQSKCLHARLKLACYKYSVPPSPEQYLLRATGRE